MMMSSNVPGRLEVAAGMTHRSGLGRAGRAADESQWISPRDAGVSRLLRDEHGSLSILRCLEIELASDPGFQRAYPTETAALAGLGDGRVAPPERHVVDATGRIIAVVRRFVAGIPLSVLLTRRPHGLDAQTAAVVVADVLAALSVLHRRGVPHRSVRAEQLIVGADGVCVLIDVGLVPRIAAAAGASWAEGADGDVEGTASRERIAARDADLSGLAGLFVECITRVGLPPGIPVPNGAPDGVPELLYSVLTRTNDPDLFGHLTAADLLVAFEKATSRTFDAGWDERGRGRLAALVEHEQRTPLRLATMVRAAWSRRWPQSRRDHTLDPPAARRRKTRSSEHLRELRARATPRRWGFPNEARDSERPSWMQRLRTPGVLGRVGVLLLLAAGLTSATVSGVHSKATQGMSFPVPRSSTSPRAVHASSSPRIGEPYPGPSASPRLSPGVSPKPSSGAGGSSQGSWQEVGWANHGTMSYDSAVSHNGTVSLRLTVAANGYEFADLTSRMAMESGSHTYSAWIRTDGPSGQLVGLDLIFFDASGRQVGSDRFASSQGGTHDWEHVSLSLATPAGAVQADLQLRLSDRGLSQGGSAWFEDVTVATP
jgi:hypothetical protein